MNKYIGKYITKDNIKYTITSEDLIKGEVIGTPEILSLKPITFSLDKKAKELIRKCSSFYNFVHQFEIIHDKKKCILDIREFSYTTNNKDIDMDVVEEYIDKILDNATLREKIIADIEVNTDGKFTKNRFLELQCVSIPKKNGEYPSVNYYSIGVNGDKIVFKNDMYYIPITIECRTKTFKKKTPLEKLGDCNYSYTRTDGKEVSIIVPNIPTTWDEEEYYKYPQFNCESFLKALTNLHKDVKEREIIAENIPQNKKKEFVKKSYEYKKHLPIEVLSELSFTGWEISFKPEYIGDKIILNFKSDIIKRYADYDKDKKELEKTLNDSKTKDILLNKKMYYKDFLCAINSIDKDKIILKLDINDELFEIERKNEYRMRDFYDGFLTTNKFAEKYTQIEYPFLKDEVKDKVKFELLSLPKNIDFIKNDFNVSDIEIKKIEELLINPSLLNKDLDKFFQQCYKKEPRGYSFNTSFYIMEVYKNISVYLFNTITSDFGIDKEHESSHVILAFEDVNLEKVYAYEYIKYLIELGKCNGMSSATLY